MAKKNAAILLIVLGVLIVLVALSFGVYQVKISEVIAVFLPEELAGLTLGKRIFGRQALGELSWMHGQEFQLNQGAVGKYGPGEDATLYVAGTPFGFMTGRLVKAMRDKIVRSESPFTPLGERKAGSRTVYELEGMGQRHYYFRSGNLVVWVAVDEAQADGVLGDVLNYYP